MQDVLHKLKAINLSVSFVTINGFCDLFTHHCGRVTVTICISRPRYFVFRVRQWTMAWTLWTDRDVFSEGRQCSWSGVCPYNLTMQGKTVLLK